MRTSSPWRSKRFGLLGGMLILFVFNGIVLATIAAAFEWYLRRVDPFLTRLPFDSEHYAANARYYPGLKVPAGRYTWGHRVSNNSLGFREREFAVPKPPGVCRIMVLGDSFTWGVGLSIHERYTGLAEASLRQAFPARPVEILSFGLPGASTARERDVLLAHRDRVQPDLIVVGFVFNDPQGKYQGYTVERERFMARYGRYLDGMSSGLARIGLGRTAKALRQAIETLTERTGLVPPWEVGLDRAYDETSADWAQFRQALDDIRSASDHQGLPRPIFAVLNPLRPLPYATDYRVRDDTLPRFLRWQHQAERAAAAAGFRTYNHERELLEQIAEAELFLNELDQHPSARVHEVFGRKLFEVLRSDLEGGRLCQ